MSGIQAQIWKGSTFTIERTQRDGAAIFRFSGPFTARDMYATLSPAALSNIFDSDAKQPHPPAAVNIFDLTEVPYMDSCGLGLIVGHFVRCQNRGVRFVAAGASTRVCELFKMTRIDQLFPMTTTVDEATLSMMGKVPGGNAGK
jgi:anti-anti-sigma factor